MQKRWGMIWVAVAVLTALPAWADTYQIDPVHSNIGFSVRHLTISQVKGEFHDFSGTIEYNPKDTSRWSVEVTIRAASIDTRDTTRDKHLRSKDFFSVDSNPTITFKSTKIVPGEGSKFDVIGDLTIRGVTKPVTLAAEMIGTIDDPRMGKRVGFTATTKIDRMDYGVSYSAPLASGGLVVGRDVNITLEAEAYIPRKK